jgi:RNA polymerase sigma factor (sigma-70 family)
MHGRSSRDVLRHLRTLYCFGVIGDLSDEQLLQCFVRRDEAAEEAFAILVERHGAMVLGVCLRLLGNNSHEAEDAFQATFLVLARKARSVSRRDKLASWLYGTAVRTANESRRRAARRKAREARASVSLEINATEKEFPDELRDILDQELARLPAAHRVAVILCELEGLSRTEAAHRLGVPEGTLSSRLARAKIQLRDRLTRRGVALSTLTISTALIRQAHAISLPLSLIESTVAAATHVVSGISVAGMITVSAATLTEGVLQAMFVTKLKAAVWAVGTMAAVASGAIVLGQSGDKPSAEPAPVGPAAVETSTATRRSTDQPVPVQQIPKTVEFEDRIKEKFTLDPEVAALTTEINELELKLTRLKESTRNEGDPAVKVVRKRLQSLKQDYNALWEAKYDEIATRTMDRSDSDLIPLLPANEDRPVPVGRSVEKPKSSPDLLAPATNPSSGTLYSALVAPPPVPAKPSTEDRTAELEKKLDKILSVLNRMDAQPNHPVIPAVQDPFAMERTGQPGSPFDDNGPPTIVYTMPGPQSVRPADPSFAPNSSDTRPNNSPDTVPPTPASGQAVPISNRLNALESKFEETVQRMSKLERRMYLLEEIVGVTNVEGSEHRVTQPSPEKGQGVKDKIKPHNSERRGFTGH